MPEFDLFRATILALIQGLTEFLPVSSSAHLILPSALLGWDDQGLAFDVAVHFGTLLAVMVYLRADIQAICRGMFLQIYKGQSSSHSTLGWYLLLATLPVIVAGFLFKNLVDSYLRQVSVIAITTLLFGILLWFADRKKSASRSLQEIDLKTVLVIGFSQILALIPGTSRSGVTMTAALFCNMDREAASRFSFLLSIPVIAGAAALLVVELLAATAVNWFELAYALVLSMVTAFVCIHYFLKFIAKVGFLPFVVYRLVLGVVLMLLVLP